MTGISTFISKTEKLKVVSDCEDVKKRQQWSLHRNVIICILKYVKALTVSHDESVKIFFDAFIITWNFITQVAGFIRKIILINYSKEKILQ